MIFAHTSQNTVRQALMTWYGQILQFPCVPDHEVEVGVLVDGGGDAAVVVEELGGGDPTVAHGARRLQDSKSFGWCSL